MVDRLSPFFTCGRQSAEVECRIQLTVGQASSLLWPPQEFNRGVMDWIPVFRPREIFVLRLTAHRLDSVVQPAGRDADIATVKVLQASIAEEMAQYGVLP